MILQDVYNLSCDVKSVISTIEKITDTNIGLLPTLIIEGYATFQLEGSENRYIILFHIQDHRPSNSRHGATWGFIDPKLRILATLEGIQERVQRTPNV